MKNEFPDLSFLRNIDTRRGSLMHTSLIYLLYSFCSLRGSSGVINSIAQPIEPSFCLGVGKFEDFGSHFKNLNFTKSCCVSVCNKKIVKIKKKKSTDFFGVDRWRQKMIFFHNEDETHLRFSTEMRKMKRGKEKQTKFCQIYNENILANIF